MQPKHQARVQALEAQGVQVVTVETEEDAAKVLGVPLKRKGNRGVTAIVNGKPVVIFIAKNFAGKKDGGAVITEELHHAAALVVLQQNPELLNEALAEVGGLNGGTAIYSKWDSLTPLGKLIEAAAAYASGKWNPDASSPVKRLVDAIMDAISKAFGLDSAQAKTATAKAIRSLADSADALLDSQPAPQEPAQASQKEASQPAPAAKPPEQMTPEEVVELEYRRQIKPLTPEEYEQKFPKPKDSASRLTWANDRKRYLWQLAAANINIPNEWVRDMPSQEFVLAAGYVKQGNEWVRRKTGIPPWKGVMAENSAIMEYPRVQEWLQKKRENAEIYAASSHSDQVNSAVWEGDSKPSVSAAAVDTYGIKLPEGYTREGDLYVYRPDGKAMIMTMKPGDRIMDEQGRMSAPMAKLKVVQTTKTGHEIWGIYFDRDGVIEGPYKLGDYAPELEEGGRIIRANEAAPSPAPASQPAGQAEAFKVGDFVRANGKGPVFKIESIGSDGWLYLANGQGSYSAEDAAKILVKSTEDAATKEAVKGGFPGFDSQPAQPPRPATPEGRAEAAIKEYVIKTAKEKAAAPDEAAKNLAGRKLELAVILSKRLNAMTGVVDYDVLKPELREASGELEVDKVGILFINPEKLIDRLAKDFPNMEKARGEMDAWMLHEFIHMGALSKMSASKIIGLYEALTPEAKEASRKLYFSGAKDKETGKELQFPTDSQGRPFNAAHEWFAQQVEAILRGEIANSGDIKGLTDPTLRESMIALLRDFVAQLRDIAATLQGKNAKLAAEIRAQAEAVGKIASDMAAKAGLEIQAGPEAEAKPAPTKAAPLTKTEQREVDRIAGNLKSTGRNPSVLNELKTLLSIQKGYEQQAIETAKHYENPNNAVYNLDTAKRQRKAAEVYKAEAARLSALIAKLEPSQAQPAPQAEPAQASQAPVAAPADQTLWADLSRFFASENSDGSRAAALKDLKAGTASDDAKGYLIDLLANPNWKGTAKSLAPQLISRLKATMAPAGEAPALPASVTPAQAEADAVQAIASDMAAKAGLELGRAEGGQAEAKKAEKGDLAKAISRGAVIVSEDAKFVITEKKGIRDNNIYFAYAKDSGDELVGGQPFESLAKARAFMGMEPAPAPPAVPEVARQADSPAGAEASGIISPDESARLDALTVNNKDRIDKLSGNQLSQLNKELLRQPSSAKIDAILATEHPDDIKTALDVVTKSKALPAALPDLTPPQAAAVAKEEAMPEPAKQAAPFDAAAAKGQKKYLLAEVAAAVKAAPKRADMTKEQKDTINDLETQAARSWDSLTKEQREAYKGEHAATKAIAERLIGYVTIEVPGDGTFTILNEKEALYRFQKKADKFPVSQAKDDLPAKPTAQAPTAVPALKKAKTTADVVAAMFPMVATDATRPALQKVKGDGTYLWASNGRVMVRVEQENGGEKGEEAVIYDEKGTAQPWPAEIKGYDGSQVIPDDKAFPSYTIDTARWFSLMSQARAVIKDLPGEDESRFKSVSLYRNPDGSLGLFASVTSSMESGKSCSMMRLYLPHKSLRAPRIFSPKSAIPASALAGLAPCPPAAGAWAAWPASVASAGAWAAGLGWRAAFSLARARARALVASLAYGLRASGPMRRSSRPSSSSVRSETGLLVA